MFDMQTPSIPFTVVEESRGRRLKMSVNRQGEVIIKAPRSIPQMVINRFVNQHLDWIVKQQATISHAKVLPDDVVLLFGQKYQVVVVYEPEKSSGCTIMDEQLQINTLTPDRPLADRGVQKILTSFLRSSASHYVLQRLPYWAEKMDITYAKVQFREQKSRWGSCSSTGTLNFNWRLVHAPPVVVDYVIIHELAHRKEMNHSSRFWQLVAKYDPEYQRHRGWLKREGRWVFPEAVGED